MREAPSRTALPGFGQFRDKIEAQLRRAGIIGDPLEHSYRAVLEIVDLLLTLRAETERLVDAAKRTATEIADPSNVLAPRVVNQVKQELRHLILFNICGQYFVPASKLAGRICLSLSLVYCAQLLTVRQDAAVERFYIAAGQYGDAWATFVGQNSLPGMIANCHKNGFGAVDVQGRRYCYVSVVLEHTESQMPTTPAWAK